MEEVKTFVAVKRMEIRLSHEFHSSDKDPPRRISFVSNAVLVKKFRVLLELLDGVLEIEHGNATCGFFEMGVFCIKPTVSY